MDAEQILREGVVLSCNLEFSGCRPRTVRASANKPKPTPRSRTAAPRSIPASSAIERWDAAVSAKIEAGSSKAQAVRTLVAEQPNLHQAFLAELSAK